MLQALTSRLRGTPVWGALKNVLPGYFKSEEFGSFKAVYDLFDPVRNQS